MSAADDFARAIQELNAELEPIMEATAGYVQKCKAAGMLDADASRCAADYHGMLLAAIAKAQGFR